MIKLSKKNITEFCVYTLPKLSYSLKLIIIIIIIIILLI